MGGVVDGGGKQHVVEGVDVGGGDVEEVAVVVEQKENLVLEVVAVGGRDGEGESGVGGVEGLGYAAEDVGGRGRRGGHGVDG